MRLRLILSVLMALCFTAAGFSQDCCLKVSYGLQHPPDHTFACVPGTVPAPNFMMQARICNPCPTPQRVYGITLQGGGTGNPASIQQVLVFLDANCDGQPDSQIPILSGNYGPNYSANLCSTTGLPAFTLPPADPIVGPGCVCLLIYYQMNCPAAPGTYFFDLVNILGPNCAPVCAENVPLRSAVKVSASGRLLS